MSQPELLEPRRLFTISVGEFNDITGTARNDRISVAFSAEELLTVK